MHRILTDPTDILAELTISREKGYAIGIWAPSLGAGLRMCGVDNILDDEIEHDKVVVLK